MASYNLDYSGARAYCTRSRCGWGLFGHFYSHLSFLSSFSLSVGDGPILTEILSQRPIKPETTNQPINVPLAKSQGKMAIYILINFFISESTRIIIISFLYSQSHSFGVGVGVLRSKLELAVTPMHVYNLFTPICI